jgi:excinuclease ABC subunit B
VIIVASVSCIYGIGSPETYSEMTIPLEVGGHMDRRELLSGLVELQYRRNDTDFVRGDTIEVFPAHYEDRAWRISLFGDEIETIQEFDPLTGERIASLEAVRVYANSHYVTPRPTLIQAMRTIKTELKQRLAELHDQNKLLEAQRIEQRTTFDLEMIEAASVCPGIENYSRHLTGRAPGEPPPTLFEYLPENMLLFVDERRAATMPANRRWPNTASGCRPASTTGR